MAEAEALSGPRVDIARSVAEALTSSPLTIVSVSDHEVVRRLVEAAGVIQEAEPRPARRRPRTHLAFAAIVVLGAAWTVRYSIPADP